MQKAKATSSSSCKAAGTSKYGKNGEAFRHQIYYCDPYTEMHAEHVGELMAGLATQMGLNSKKLPWRICWFGA